MSQVDALGSGSDFTPFLQHLGVAATDMGFDRREAGSYGVYHSVYDSVRLRLFVGRGCVEKVYVCCVCVCVCVCLVCFTVHVLCGGKVVVDVV